MRSRAASLAGTARGSNEPPVADPDAGEHSRYSPPRSRYVTHGDALAHFSRVARAATFPPTTVRGVAVQDLVPRAPARTEAALTGPHL
jgi:hypothetical protein